MPFVVRCRLQLLHFFFNGPILHLWISYQSGSQAVRQSGSQLERTVRRLSLAAAAAILPHPQLASYMSSNRRFNRAALGQHQRAISGISESRTEAAKLRRLAELSVLEAAEVGTAIADDDATTTTSGVGDDDSSSSRVKPHGRSTFAEAEQQLYALYGSTSAAMVRARIGGGRRDREEDEDERRAARDKALKARKRALRGDDSSVKSTLRVLVRESVERAAGPLSRMES